MQDLALDPLALDGVLTSPLYGERHDAALREAGRFDEARAHEAATELHGKMRKLGADRYAVVPPGRSTGRLSARRAHEAGWYFAPRQGGERLRPRAHGPSRTLKNLLQERGVPPWERERLPLLCHAGRLVWVPGVGLEAEYACPPGEAGLKPRWEVAGKAPLC